MGTRIHKIIGWGLNDIQIENLDIVDFRINTDFFKSEDYWKKENDVEDFFQWIKDNREKCEQIIREVEPDRLTGKKEKEGNIQILVLLLLFGIEKKKRKNTIVTLLLMMLNMGWEKFFYSLQWMNLIFIDLTI